MSGEITRDTDEETGLRWYTNGDDRFLSVTTVLKFLEEDETGLEIWKDKNDGKGDNAHWEHIYWYSGPRGTLCHYQALKAYEDHYDGDGELWGEEEAESMHAVLHGPKDGFEEASEDMDDIVYSIANNQGTVTSVDQYEHLFGNLRLVDILHEDLEYFVDKFNEIREELVAEPIAVERFLLSDEGYGGQCDLCYEDPDGNVVVADLKSSSSLRQKHRLQSVAYMKAVERDPEMPDEVDRVEVWRIDPDSKEFEVHTSSVPEHARHLDWYSDDHFFDDKWGSFSYDSIDDMWDKFTELIGTAHDEAES
jgi:hypothetical protein